MAESTPGELALFELQDRRQGWYAHVGRPLQLPEPGLVLDLSPRRGSDVRTLKHLHQMCMIQRENYGVSSQVKHLYLVDAFFTLAEAENPLALFSVARSMFELNAFLHEIQRRLQQTALALTPNNWVPMGEKFFGLIVRARFATTNPALRAVLSETGVSAKRLDPFNITQCVTGLAEEPDQVDAVERYAVLCDSVHHNLGSMTLANSGSGVADAAWSSGGGMLVSTGAMTVTQYEYPAQGQSARALEELAPGFLRDALGCVQWLNMTPASPFSPEFLREVTGSELGVETLLAPRDLR
jgi:hypothetical protein